MANHLYRVGTVVYLQPSEGNLLPRARPYMVEAQMPPVGTSFQYRVKSEAESFRRVVPEYLVSKFADQNRTGAEVVPVHSGEED